VTLIEGEGMADVIKRGINSEIDKSALMICMKEDILTILLLKKLKGTSFCLLFLILLMDFSSLEE
jgi:hypothetical protein